jgi:D-alanyl-lipoteichoic acid acyltransferase DltB (MBOAT superfamily)
MAIGFALLLGFRLPMNFNSPYKALHVGDFWKRWHISLSSWLKDYLYIPMGGNRGGSIFSYIMVGVILFFVSVMSRTWWVPAGALVAFAGAWASARKWPGVKRRIETNINLMLTMTIGGLWHGASWSMVIWGALNGLGLIIYKGTRSFIPWKNHQKWHNRAISTAVTLTFITFTRVWFRGENPEKSKIMLQQIGNQMDWGRAPAILSELWLVFVVMGAGYLIHWIPEDWKERYRMAFIRLPLIGKAAVGAGVFVLIYQVMSADLQPFIYFAF